MMETDLFRPSSTQDDRHIYRVSELNRDVQILLDSAFPALWVEGEISNFSMPSSGHWYFTLKDAQAQVRCAMFKNRNRSVFFKPEHGQHVVIKARVSLYEPRGDFQLVVENMERAGDGALQKAFDELKKRLNAEGLFDTAAKKPLPFLPRAIGVVTSPTGAAIRDILSVLKRRFPAIPVVIYPVPVQGEGAATHIARAIDLASQRRDCDVLIIARGGGSLEDLWAFNEEVVARAIHRCEIPTVCGVGHEIDFTIADFVADRRAPTPSAAAEMVVPDASDWLNQFARTQARLIHLTSAAIRARAEKVRWLAQRLVHPSRQLQNWAQRIDELEQRLHRSLRHNLAQKRFHIDTLAARFARHTPIHRIEKSTEKQLFLQQRLFSAQRRLLDRFKDRLAQAAVQLETVSPLATLRRGYAIVQSEDEQVVRSFRQVGVGDRITAKLGEGFLECKVENTREN